MPTPPQQRDILLATLNAKYAHASFGLRYLMANLGDLHGRAAMLEFDISQRPLDIVEAILARGPKIVGLGIYIWNVTQSTELVASLKRVRPDITVVLGGPEVSYETDQQEITRLADYVITGEADRAFADLCRQLLSGRRPLMRVIPAALPEFAAPAGGGEGLSLPYDLYTPEDIAHRVIYVEASRGCPFKCEFCLSSLDSPVRNVPLGPFLQAMRGLLDRGVRQFKFVDRTFNLNLNVGQAILGFFLERYTPGLFLHFEMIPDRLPEALREPIRQFPPGALQFEVGIQSFNEDVCRRISRRQNAARVADNLRFLRDETGVHVHADLIAGLPGEDLESFAAGFDRLVELRPQEIQLGILKRLRGTPIVRHDTEWGMTYAAHPPYEVLGTKHVDFNTMQRVRRFARYWDLIANSGNFVRSTPLVWGSESPFASFMALSDWLFAQAGRNHAIALLGLAELLFRYLTEVAGGDAKGVAGMLWEDYRQGGRRDGPEFLRPFVGAEALRSSRRALPRSTGPGRQSRHLQGAAADGAALMSPTDAPPALAPDPGR